MEERKEETEKYRRQIEEMIKSQEPNHDKYIKTVNELFSAIYPELNEQRACELYNELGFSKCDNPEEIGSYGIDNLFNALYLTEKIYSSYTDTAKKLAAELLWLNHLAYDRGYTLNFMYGATNDVEEIIQALLECGNATFNLTEYEEYYSHTSARRISSYNIYNLAVGYFDIMRKVFGNGFRVFSEVLAALLPQESIRNKTNSLNKMRNILATFEKLNDALNSVKGSNASFKIIAEAFQKMAVEPSIESVKCQIEQMKKKEKEKPKQTRTYTATPGSKLDGASKDGRYVPYISSSTDERKSAGRGGYGAVAIYWDTQEKCKVAIKTKKGGKSFGSKITDLPQIKSPYVAAYKDLTTLIIKGKEVPGLVMEYVHGQTCFIDQIYRLSPEKLLETCKQLIDGFEAFAEAGYCHQDLHTHFENVRMDKEGNIKIIDYEDASGNPTRNRNLAINYVLATLNAYHNGDELCDKFLEQFPELYDQVEKYMNRRSVKAYYQYNVKGYAPTFDELRDALDHLKDEKAFG